LTPSYCRQWRGHSWTVVTNSPACAMVISAPKPPTTLGGRRDPCPPSLLQLENRFVKLNACPKSQSWQP
jgi:hypothetical protein